MRIADPGDRLEMDENQSTVIGQYTRLCKTPLLRLVLLMTIYRSPIERRDADTQIYDVAAAFLDQE